MSRMFPPIGDVDAYAANNPFMAYNHIQITAIGEDANGDHYAEVSVELRPESMNLHGAVHGGLLYGLADCVAGIVARCDGSNHGTVFARAEVIRRGRRMAVVHVTVRDGEDNLLADCAVDMMRMET